MKVYIKTGCYWCKHREGLKCLNEIKRKRNGNLWDLSESIKQEKNPVCEESLKIPLKSDERLLIGCKCSEFDSLMSEESVVFT